MYSAIRLVSGGVFCAIVLGWPVICGAQGAAAEESAATLRVCADPNNLPFSNQQQQGFENKLAEMVAHDLGKTLEYTWVPQRSHFFRKTLQANACDLVMGVPAHLEAASTTIPLLPVNLCFCVATRQPSAH